MLLTHIRRLLATSHKECTHLRTVLVPAPINEVFARLERLASPTSGRHRVPFARDHQAASPRWSVETRDHPVGLLLRSELDLPGTAHLGWTLRALSPHTTVVTQSIRFYSRGMYGRCYWAATRSRHRSAGESVLRQLRASCITPPPFGPHEAFLP